VVNADNASVQQMSTEEVLDLLELSPAINTGTAAGEGAGAAAGGGGRALQTLLTSVGELWAEEEYEQEYDLDEFLDQIA
jgi:TATA-binding protein-associated factor